MKLKTFVNDLPVARFVKIRVDPHPQISAERIDHHAAHVVEVFARDRLGRGRPAREDQAHYPQPDPTHQFPGIHAALQVFDVQVRASRY